MLKTTLGEAGLTQLITLYHQQASDYTAQMAACFSASPLSREQLHHVARLAHQLRGESVSIGADRVAELARQLETLAKTEEAIPSQLEDVFSTLRRSAAHTHAALETWCGDNLSD
jgi:HPt (histidine-containing phosphotransfer) domain-containing protein